jgi:hypothetical protein
MLRLMGAVLAVLLALPAARAEDKPKDRPDTPADQYKALVKEYQSAVLGNASAEERARLAEEKYAPKLLELAEKHPDDPAAVDALLWVERYVHTRGKDSPRTRALELLARDHIKSDRLGPLCQNLARAVDQPSGDFLRAVLDKSPSREVRGQACAALLAHLRDRKFYAQVVQEKPQLAERVEKIAGQETTEELKKLDPAKVDEERGKLLKLAADQYADVKVGKQTLGERVKAELAQADTTPQPKEGELVGKEAPEIKGEDLDGKPLKLSDYKGKVVLLDFWGNW